MRVLPGQTGFTLLEVLIAMVILSIGLLATAALQTQSVRYTQNAYALSVATQQAEDMAERMRANLAEANTIGGYYDNLSGTYTAGTDCAATNCNQTERAQFDHQEWSNRIQAALGASGTGTVQRVGNHDIEVVAWQELDPDGNTATQTYTLSIVP